MSFLCMENTFMMFQVVQEIGFEKLHQICQKLKFQQVGEVLKAFESIQTDLNLFESVWMSFDKFRTLKT